MGNNVSVWLRDALYYLGLFVCWFICETTLWLYGVYASGCLCGLWGSLYQHCVDFMGEWLLVVLLPYINVAPCLARYHTLFRLIHIHLVCVCVCVRERERERRERERERVRRDKRRECWTYSILHFEISFFIHGSLNSKHVTFHITTSPYYSSPTLFLYCILLMCVCVVPVSSDVPIPLS